MSSLSLVRAVMLDVCCRALASRKFKPDFFFSQETLLHTNRLSTPGLDFVVTFFNMGNSSQQKGVGLVWRYSISYTVS